MRFTPKLPLLPALLIVALSTSAPLLPSDAKQPAAPVWTNPLVPERADPWVLRDTDGTYLFTATVPAYDRIELRRGRTLGELGSAKPSVIWTKHASGPMSHHIWAPELHRIDGKWYVYFAAGRADNIWAIRMYVLECASADPLAGPWIERGQLKTHLETFSLDATTFEHRGVRYLCWAQHNPETGGNTSIYLARMDTPWSITGQPVILSAPEFSWETAGYRVNEGPAFLRHGDRVFITYSASATDANYCLGLLAASADSDLLDPVSWKKSARPVLATDEKAKVFGPGHNSFTTLSDGSDVLVYHARDYRDIKGDPLANPDRATRASLIRWTPEGTPLFQP